MVWIASRSTEHEHRVLGVFDSLDQAEQYVEQQVVGRPVTWTPGDHASRGRHYADGPVVYAIERCDLPNRPRLAELRAWQLRCADCGAEWTVTPEAIVAGDDWLACPHCGGGRARSAESSPAP